ncbi:hypothetical protein ACR3FT_002206 [Yersinia enterocolitica]|uniref:hypothetical protein n=1 Tax=Yersinia TaxID=629 RepID=UPI000173993A|nr:MULTISPECIES: hypothetical protein [Yersinia]ELM3738347.1 hypothetical protein [Yersinia ruckeri]CQD56476.1 Uncharacterised protein [Yersinia intermedia]AJJ02393.1 hypothetical protein BZ21_3149 [Yersinia pseudotuberculosis]AJJ69171.1 hypothetical protein BZ16_3262 [Yersinia pseudotuberculosis PB1/+]AYX16501.1 hypothetical protein EGX44_15780 [Yersinia pseudotuberculosis]
MSTRKPTAAKRPARSSSVRSRAKEIISNDTIKSEYNDVLYFAIQFNKRQYRTNGQPLSDVVIKTVETALKNFILAGQARNIPPRVLKRMVALSGRKDRSYRDWKPDAALEQRHSLMAGATRKVRAG